MEARRGRDAVAEGCGGSMRYAHDSATGHAPLAGTPTQVTPNFNK